jgi:vancomycin resistance protein YoaR
MKWLKILLAGLMFVFCFIAQSASAQKIELGSFPLGNIEKQLPNELKIKVNESDYSIKKSEILAWISETSELKYRSDYLSEVENTDYCAYKKSIICSLSFSRIREKNIQKKSTIFVDNELIDKKIGQIAQAVNRPSEDAKFKIEDGKVSAFSLQNNGLSLDEEKSREELVSYLQKQSFPESINLPFKEIKSDLPQENVDNMGVTSLIGEGRSNFRGSPKNRIFNIKVATERFNGVLIKPDEEFSFVEVLGEVDGDHGYLPELVIKKDKTEPEFGGGICQVSTTAFRAALNSGLEITARRNHAYPVQYYNPQGMDATVYVPKPDLRFKNNTPGYILIQTKIEGTELIFDFYGTSDERKVNLIGPKIISRNPDGSMKTTLTQQVLDKDGNILREDVFNSSYDSPSKYPHPGTTSDVLAEKPNGWSDNEWKKYKRAHGL